MATFYWRGGTGPWTNASTANWAAAATAATFTASRNLTTLTVTAMASGAIAAGDTVWHTNGTSAGVVAAFGTGGTTGTGGVGTYTVSLSGTLTSRTMSSATIGAGPTTSADDVVFDADSNVGTATFTVTPGATAPACRDFTASGLDAAMTLAVTTSFTVHGNFSVPASNFTVTGTQTITFAATTAKTITSNGVSLTTVLVFNGVSGSWQLQDNLTTTAANAVTLTNGTLDLNDKTLTATRFFSDNSNTRAIAFGTAGKISLNTNNTTIVSMATMTGFSFTGTSNIEATYSGATGTRTFSMGTTAGATSANALSITITAGTDTVLFFGTSNAVVRNLNLSGFAGTYSGANTAIYGDTIFGPAMTMPASGFNFAATSGTQTVTFNGKTFLNNVTYSAAGGTLKLLDAGGGTTFTLTNGTLDFNGTTFTVSTSFATGAGTKAITWNGGKITVTASGATAFNNANPTNFTTSAGSGAGTIDMTSGSAKTFVGGGSTFNAKLNQGGAGNLTLTGSSTFTDLTNTVNSTSILFTAATTTTFTAGFHVNDSTIGSVTAANHNLSMASGIVTVSNNAISRSQAAGGAVWYSLLTNGNTDGGNNSGWIFAFPANTNFLMLF